MWVIFLCDLLIFPPSCVFTFVYICVNSIYLATLSSYGDNDMAHMCQTMMKIEIWAKSGKRNRWLIQPFEKSWLWFQSVAPHSQVALFRCLVKFEATHQPSNAILPSPSDMEPPIHNGPHFMICEHLVFSNPTQSEPLFFPRTPSEINVAWRKVVYKKKNTWCHILDTSSYVLWETVRQSVMITYLWKANDDHQWVING